MNLREWALPIYTILMQLAVGTLLVLWVIRAFNLRRLGEAAMDRVLRKPVLVMFFTIVIAVLGSHLHLSNPLRSFLAVMNIRTSWLSREIAFTVLCFLSCAALVDQIWKPGEGRQWLKTCLGWMAVFSGVAAIYCMASIYLLPTQAPWNNGTTIALFYCSSLILGITSATALLVMDANFSQLYEPDLIDERLGILKRSLGWLAGLAMAVLATIASVNVAQIWVFASRDKLTQTSISLLFGLYQPLFDIRMAVLVAGVGIFMLAAFWLLKKGKSLDGLITPIYTACFLALVSEILGRFLFYASHVRLGI